MPPTFFNKNESLWKNAQGQCFDWVCFRNLKDLWVDEIISSLCTNFIFANLKYIVIFVPVQKLSISLNLIQLTHLDTQLESPPD